MRCWIAWYSPSVTSWIYLYVLKHGLGINGFRPTWHCPIVEVLQAKRNSLNHLVTLLWSAFTQKNHFWLLLRCYGCVRPHKVGIHKLDYVALSSLRLLSHIRNETMHNVSTHQLPRYYQPLRVPATAWTASFTWGTRRKLVLTTKNIAKLSTHPYVICKMNNISTVYFTKS